jgi:integrase
MGIAFAFLENRWHECRSQHYLAFKGRSEREIKLASERLREKARLAGIHESVNAKRLADQWLKDYKPTTVLRRLAVLSHVFSIARKEWGMDSLSNPVELIRKPQPNNARTRRIALGVPLSYAACAVDSESDRNALDGELERVVAASGSPLLPALIWIAVETAMRRSEITALRWGHVDLTRRVAHLPAKKNGSARDVPLSSLAVAMLDTLKPKRDDARREIDQSEEADLGRVFEIRSDAVTRAFERAVNRARKLYLGECQVAEKRPDSRFLTDLRFHDLRHGATSRLASIFALHELTKITGHKDPRMLMRYYHPRAENLAKRLN